MSSRSGRSGLQQSSKVKLSFRRYSVCQAIKEPSRSDKADLSSFLLQNVLLLVFIAVGYLLVAILVGILLQTMANYRTKIIARIVSSTFFLNYKQLGSVSNKVSTLFVFFNLFLFINFEILSCTIKVDKLLINTGKAKRISNFENSFRK